MAIDHPVKDVLLVGFGAVGAMYSLILQRSGLVRVTVVARSNYAAVKAHGVHYKSLKYGDITGWKPDRLFRSVAEAADREYSYVFVTTKAIPEITKTSDILAPLLAAPYSNQYPQPTYIVMQNGLNVEADLYKSLKLLGKGDPSIISVAVWTCANLLEPNVVNHNAFDKVIIGAYRHKDHMTTVNSLEEATVLEDVSDILESGGSTVEIVPEIQRMKFTKNFWNVAFASFATLTNYTLSAIFRPPPSANQAPYTPYVSPTTLHLIEAYTIPALRDTLKELLCLGRAMGFPDSDEGLPSSAVDDAMQNIRALYEKPHSSHKPSMLLDAEKGQPIEVEVILGEVVRMARERNVPVPRVETLYALLLVVQNQLQRNAETRNLEVAG